MAATTTNISRAVPGSSFQSKTLVACDNSYPSGGYPITPQQCGYNSYIRRVLEVAPVNFASAGVVPVVIEVLASAGSSQILGLTLQLQNFASGAELAAGTNASAYSYNLVTEGI